MQSESMDVDMGGGAPMGESAASNPPQEDANELSAAPTITCVYGTGRATEAIEN